MSLTRHVTLHQTKKLVEKAEEYLKHVIKRDSNSKLTEDWYYARKYLGKPQRVHGDAKSITKGAFTLWVKLGALPESKEKVPKPIVLLCNPGTDRGDVFKENHLLMTVEVDPVAENEWKDEEFLRKITKNAIREAWKAHFKTDLDDA
ncbi:hypothetical protein ONZ45_g17733 [Pleurotus djamor]|nr:hypothetical protein ONZ45_g17733 [Pleurotus djamor]